MRTQDWLAANEAALIGGATSPDCVELHYRKDAQYRDALTALVAAENVCCDFGGLEFTLDEQPDRYVIHVGTSQKSPQTEEAVNQVLSTFAAMLKSTHA